MKSGAFYLKLAVSLALLFALAWSVDLSQLAKYGGKLPLWVLLAGSFMVILFEFFNGAKVGFILRTRATSFFARINFMKTFFMNFLPGSFSGEAIRLLYLGARLGSHSRAAGALFLDRWTGLLAHILIASFSCIFIFPEPYNRYSIFLFGFSALGCLFSFSVLRKLTLFGRKVLSWINRRWKRNFRFDEGISQVIQDLCKSPFRFTAVLAFSLVYQVLILWVVLALARGMDLELGFFHLSLVLFAGVLISSLPISLGGWGLTEGAFAVAFEALHAESEAGVALSLALRLITLPASLAGLLLFLKDEKSLKQFWRSARNRLSTSGLHG